MDPALAAPGAAAAPGPTPPEKRIESLDVLRGFALLGILVMNIQSFSMVSAAYLNPEAAGDLTGINRAVWLGSHLLADMKFITLFSILFGAGIVLVARRRVAAGRGAAGLHLRRMVVLLGFGLVHAYGLWYGDILVSYAVCGTLVFWAWRWPAWLQLAAGLLLLAIGTGLNTLWLWTLPHWPAAELEEFRAMLSPTDAAAEAERAAYRGGWWDQMSHRAEASLMMQTFYLLVWGVWRIAGTMLIGMALLKWRVLTAERSDRCYAALALVLGPIGLGLVGLGVIEMGRAGFGSPEAFFGGTRFNYWGSLALAVAYAAGVMLVVRRAWIPRVRAALAAVGRTALSNYLLQTLICTTLFYGHGLGLFGRVERWGQLAIVAAVWAVQIALTRWWLARFRTGPAEWLWRVLSYGQRVPLARSGAPVV